MSLSDQDRNLLLSQDVTEQLIQAAKAAWRNSDPAHSNFSVGAALINEDGKIFSGTNWEIASWHGSATSICGERSAIASLQKQNGSKIIKALVVLGGQPDNDVVCTPCGTCRDFIWNHGKPETVIIAVGPDGDLRAIHQLKDLYPLPPGPIHYSDCHRLTYLSELPARQQEIFAQLAEKQQSLSYHPYTGRAHAVAIETKDNDLYCAAPIEIANFSSTTASRNALALMISHNGPDQTIANIYCADHPNSLLDDVPHGSLWIAPPNCDDRQALNEFIRNPSNTYIHCRIGNQILTRTFADIYPFAFGPHNLELPH